MTPENKTAVEEIAEATAIAVARAMIDGANHGPITKKKYPVVVGYLKRLAGK